MKLCEDHVAHVGVHIMSYPMILFILHTIYYIVLFMYIFSFQLCSMDRIRAGNKPGPFYPQNWNLIMTPQTTQQKVLDPQSTH